MFVTRTQAAVEDVGARAEEASRPSKPQTVNPRENEVLFGLYLVVTFLHVDPKIPSSSSLWFEFKFLPAVPGDFLTVLFRCLRPVASALWWPPCPLWWKTWSTVQSAQGAPHFRGPKDPGEEEHSDY